MSCPVRARDSACAVSSSLLPIEVMKSMRTSTPLAAPHSSQTWRMTSLAPGTQWSHRPMDSSPAERALLTQGAATAAAPAAAAAVFRNRRRDGAAAIMAILPLPDGAP